VGLWVGVNVGRVGNLSGVKVGGGVTVSVGLTGVISARRWGPAQDTSPAPSAARNPFWRNFLLVSFLLMVTTSFDPELALMKGCVCCSRLNQIIPQNKAPVYNLLTG
jgi:hypothetical protein